MTTDAAPAPARLDEAALRRAVAAMVDYVRDMDEARDDWTDVCDEHPVLDDDASPVRGLEDAQWRLARLADGLGLLIPDPRGGEEPLVLVFQQDGAWLAHVRAREGGGVTVIRASAQP